MTESDISTPLANNFRLPQPLKSREVYYVDLNEDTNSNYIAECQCNLRGTENYDCNCHCVTGQCNCDNANGYTGLTCDECLTGWFLEYNTTCTGFKHLFQEMIHF